MSPECLGMMFTVGSGRVVYGAGTPFEGLGLNLHSNTELLLSNGIIGLCGQTGSGKSTFLSLLAGEHRHSGIEVKLDGQMPMPPAVGSVFQQPEDQLFCASVREELLFAPRNFKMAEPDDLALIEILTKLGFKDCGTFLDRDPLLLSGGEKRRIALASILCFKPSVLLLDEPFAGVDPLTMRILISSLLLLAQSGVGIVYSGHEVFEMSLICSEILCFSEQAIVNRGSPVEISQWLCQFTGDDIFLDWRVDDLERRKMIGRRACIPHDLI